jgi:4'-phosphopantetheinyl transferase EntD
MPISASLRTGSERFAGQQQAFARPLPPDRVPDPVLLTVLSCPFYGVTPTIGITAQRWSGVAVGTMGDVRTYADEMTVGEERMNRLLQLIRVLMPHGVALAGGAIGPREASAFEIEEKAVANAVADRRHEFRAARTYARVALQMLGHAPCAIGVGPQRQPIWPEGIVGAITHSDEFAAAIAARAVDYHGLGIDIERNVPLDPDIINLVCRCEERALGSGYLGNDIDMPKLFFVIKEAVFKAYFPRTQAFLDFQNVSVRVDRLNRSFRAILVDGSKPPLAGIREFNGRFAHGCGYLAAFVSVAASVVQR